jgi:hypothetical protein
MRRHTLIALTAIHPERMPEVRVRARISARTVGGDLLTTGYFLEPLCGESQEAPPKPTSSKI